MRDLSWTCHVCGKRRPDKEIGVVTRHAASARGLTQRMEMTHSLRYCIPDPECTATAQEWADHPHPLLWSDGLPEGTLGRVAEEESVHAAAIYRRRRIGLYAAGALIVLALGLFLAARGEAVSHSSAQIVRSDQIVHVPAWWVKRQMEVATILGVDGDRQGTDPWPNCPDPFDHRGHSWRDTVRCENRAYAERFGVWDPRTWLDSPGYFRCGLQFEPRWERRYGRLCP